MPNYLWRQNNNSNWNVFTWLEHFHYMDEFVEKETYEIKHSIEKIDIYLFRINIQVYKI